MQILTPKKIDGRTNKPINPRTLRFVNAYIEHGNGSRAVIESGFNSSHPDQRAYQLLQTKRVQDAVERLTLNKFSKGYVARKLDKIATVIDQPTANFQDRAVAVKALEAINNIQGHNAPLKTENLNVSATVDDIRSITEQYSSDY